MTKRYAAFALIALALIAAGFANAQTLKFSPSSVNLYAQSGTAYSAQQTITVTASDNTTVMSFNLAPNTAWINVLSATPPSGWKTPASVTISVNPSLLPLGRSTGLLNFSGTGFFQTVQVNVTVSSIGVTLPVTGGQSSILQLGTYQAGSTVYPAAIPALLVAGDIANLRIAQPPADTWYTYSAPQQFGTPPSLATTVAFNQAVAASLTPGSYSSTLTLTPEGASPVPVVIPVTLTVTPSPQVTVTPPSLTFFWQHNGNNQTRQFVTLASNATQAIGLNVSSTVSWITIPVANPTIPAGGSIQLEVDVPQVAGDAQPTGPSNGTIQIAMPAGGALFDNGTTSRSLPVRLNVTNYPVLTVANSPMTFTSKFGSSVTVPASYTVVPTTSGAAVSYNAASVATDNWVSVSPSAITTQNTDSGSITVTLNPAGLLPGSYSSSITVTPLANGSGQGPTTIPVTLTVTFGNTLQTNFPSNPLVCSGTPCMVFAYQVGQATPASQTVLLSTTTGAPLNYAITPPAATAGWVRVDGPLTGTTDNTSFTVSIVPGAIGTPLPSSPQDATINIAATDPVTGAAVNSISLDVKLYIGTTAQLVVSSTQPAVTALPPVMLSTWPGSSKYPGNDQPPVYVYLSSSQPITQDLTNLAVQHAVTGQSSYSDWLLVNNPWTGTPTSFTIGAVRDPSHMPVGTYTGSVTVSASPAPGGTTPVADSPITIPVQFTINTAKGSVSCYQSPDGCSMTFTQTKGGPLPAKQVVQVSTDTLSLPFDPIINTGLDSWLTVSGITGPTPGSFNVSADATNLPIGVSHGAIYVNIPNASPNPDGSPIRIPVTFNVNGGAICAGTCASAQGPLTFTQVIGGSAPAPQTIPVVSTPSSITYTIGATVTTPVNGSWLVASITSGGGVTPGVVTVTATPGSLGAGTYNGSVTITSPGATNSPITIQVSLVVQQATISAPTTTLQFSQLAGGPAPAAQSIAVTSTPAAAIPFSVGASTGNGVPWLAATVGSAGTNGTTPGTVSVSVSAGLLSPGQYSGLVTISAPGALGSPISINVLLNVGAAVQLSVSQTALTFGAVVGHATTPQTVLLTASASTPFTATAAVKDSGAWLSVNPSSGTASTTAVTLTISANTQNLAAGNYTGTVTISSASSLTPAVINVTLTVSAIPPPLIVAVKNAASYATNAVAPGEIIAIGGTGIGPLTPAYLALTPTGQVSTNIGSTQVLFDGTPAPITYASATQTNVVVPYEIGGRTATNIQVVYSGVPSASLSYAVAQVVPGIFTQNSAGFGPGSILNQDGITINGSNAPAAKGSVVSIYMTGEGATTPASSTGGVAGTPGNGLNHPLQTVTATVAGAPATVAYAGSAPGLVYGAMQVNITIPANTPSGAQPVVIYVGSTPSQANVTVAVQ